MPASQPVKHRVARQAARSVALPLARMAGFAAMLAALVVGAGLSYTLVLRHRPAAAALWAWLSHLSPEQVAALGASLAAGPIMIAGVYHWVSRGIGQPRQRLAAAALRLSILLLTFALYAWGARKAYRVSLLVTRSRDWALIHSLYSWGYLAFAFIQWSAAHAAQPFTRTVREFWRILAR